MKTNADKVFSSPKKSKGRNKTDQVWFNAACKDKRKACHRAKNRYSFIKNKENRDAMKLKGKAYKVELNKSFRSFQHKLESDLRNVSKSDSKKFWKILKRLDKGGSTKDIKITVEQLYDYFKALNKSDEIGDDNIEDLLQSIDNQDITDILDREITEDEILSAVKDLCNGKAPGDDEVVNEYIKCTVNQFLPIDLKLFNLVFNSGIVPDSWLIGIIKPLYKNKGDPNNLDNYRAICLTSNLGKVFTSILNSRLNKLSDEIGLITDAHGGFL